MREHSEESQVVEDLVLRAKQGDIEAQTRLFRRYWPLIKRVVAGRIYGSDSNRARLDAEDLSQEVALRLLVSLPKHEWQNRGAFAAWLRRIASTVSEDHRRYHRAAKRDVQMDVQLDEQRRQKATRSPESKIDDGRQAQRFKTTLERLPPADQAAIQLREMGFSLAEIGDLLDCTAGAANKRIARARVRLQQLAHPR